MPQIVGLNQGLPDPLDGLIIAPFEAQHGTVVKGEPTKVQAGDERPPRGRVEPKLNGVTLVMFPDRLVGTLLGQMLTDQVCIERIQ